MWRNGFGYFLGSPFTGTKIAEEKALIEQSYADKKMQSFAYYHLTRGEGRTSYHNAFIQAMVKGGIIALMLIFMLVFFPILYGSKKYRLFYFMIVSFSLVLFNFESQITIYSSCAYFYLLYIGFIVSLSNANTSTTNGSS